LNADDDTQGQDDWPTLLRSTARDNPAQFTVNFGMGGGGLTIATVTESGPMKMAA
jgi:hypothetical protein